MNRLRRGRRDEGSATLESAICIPLLVFLIGLTAAYGLVGVNTSAVDNAARAAARAASQATDADYAAWRGRQAARDALEREGWDCATSHVSIDTSGFTAPLGQAASVTATVECTVPLGRLTVPGLPGSKTLTSEFTSPLDPYVER